MHVYVYVYDTPIIHTKSSQEDLPSTNWSPMITRKAMVVPKVYSAMHSWHTTPNTRPHIPLTTPSNEEADVTSTPFANDIKLPTTNATSI